MDFDTLLYILFIVGSIILSAVQSAKKERRKKEEARRKKPSPPEPPDNRTHLPKEPEKFSFDYLKEQYEKEFKDKFGEEPDEVVIEEVPEPSYREELPDYFEEEYKEAEEINEFQGFIPGKGGSILDYQSGLNSEIKVELQEDEEEELYYDFEFEPVKAIIYSEILKRKF